MSSRSVFSIGIVGLLVSLSSVHSHADGIPGKGGLSPHALYMTASTVDTSVTASLLDNLPATFSSGTLNRPPWGSASHCFSATSSKNAAFLFHWSRLARTCLAVAGSSDGAKARVSRSGRTTVEGVPFRP